MGYGDLKDLYWRSAFDKVLCAKPFKTAKNPKCNGYQRGPAWVVYKYFDRKSATTHTGTRINSISEN